MRRGRVRLSMRVLGRRLKIRRRMIKFEVEFVKKR